MSKYTQGPWVADPIKPEDRIYWRILEYVHPERAAIALVSHEHDRFTDSKTAEANACLIAAAPKLLEALRLYVKLDNDRRSGCEILALDWAECHQAADAAIAKAEPKS
jgi:hypothetical protein